jgi:hypothetical protein
MVAPTVAAREPRARLLRVQGMPLRRWLTTTPGRLRAASALILAALLVLVIVMAGAASTRGDSARAVGLEAVPELGATANLYGALADADATATSIFLQAGTEQPELRRRYLGAIKDAGSELAAVSRDVGSSPTAQRAVRTIAEALPKYTGRIETARVYNRQGFPLGAAYLRDGSRIMHDEILPAATTLYERAARRLDEQYRSGTSSVEVVLVVLAGIVVLGLLVATQVLVTRQYNRILNVGLVAATVIVVVLLGWAVGCFVAAQNALVRAQREGSDTVQVASAARILTLRAQADDNLALTERGTGDKYLSDFADVTTRLGGADGSGGLLREVSHTAAGTSAAAFTTPLRADFSELLASHDAVRAADNGGDYNGAIKLAVGRQADVGREAPSVQNLDADLRRVIANAQQRLDARAADARAGFDLLAVAIPLLAILAGAFVIAGLQRRIAEY